MCRCKPVLPRGISSQLVSYFRVKKFWKISCRTLKKNMPSDHSYQNQNRQGFLRLQRWRVLILQVFQYLNRSKRLTERHYGFFPASEKMNWKNSWTFRLSLTYEIRIPVINSNPFFTLQSSALPVPIYPVLLTKRVTKNGCITSPILS